VPLRLVDPQIRVVLLDIEGTTTPVDFVYKTLFPYASREVESYLREHSLDPEIQSLASDLRAQRQRDADAGLAPPAWSEGTDAEILRSSIDYARWLMARDSKCTPLKTLQGKIWHRGYERGELYGEVYPDVPLAFARWRQQGREICIYSSGSVLAQRLLFRSTASGDLTEHISRFFDTGVGAKTESASYSKIAETLGHNAKEILFLSDTRKEIDAARAASMEAMLCLRDSKPEAASGEGFITSFDQVFQLETSA
jgi:enolase-phosphatase E1